MNLAAIRDERKITQQELADTIGITRQMISAIENGGRPSVDTAKKIAGVLGIEWTGFFDDDAPPNAYSTLQDATGA